MVKLLKNSRKLRIASFIMEAYVNISLGLQQEHIDSFPVTETNPRPLKALTTVQKSDEQQSTPFDYKQIIRRYSRYTIALFTSLGFLALTLIILIRYQAALRECKNATNTRSGR